MAVGPGRIGVAAREVGLLRAQTFDLTAGPYRDRVASRCWGDKRLMTASNPLRRTTGRRIQGRSSAVLWLRAMDTVTTGSQCYRLRPQRLVGERSPRRMTVGMIVGMKAINIITGVLWNREIRTQMQGVLHGILHNSR